MSDIKTLEQVEAEIKFKLAELAHVEGKLAEIHDKEGQIRTELQHLEIQRQRLIGIMGTEA